MRYYCSLIILLFIFFSCKSVKEKRLTEICYARDFSQPVEKVSLQDVERIKQSDGKFIEVEGIFRYAFEDVGLYPSKTASPSKAMWLDLRIPATIPDSVLYELNERKVVVIGRVNLKSKGHYSGYMGTLDSAFCIKMK